MQKHKEPIVFQLFDEDAVLIREYVGKPQNVYTNKKGKMEINYLTGRRTVLRDSKGRLICFNGQKMPVRKSATAMWRAEE